MLDTSLSDAEKYPLKLADLIVMPLDTEKAPVSIQWANHPNLHIKDLPSVGFAGDKLYRPLRFDDEWIPYEGSVMAIDPSGRGADETTYAIVKQLHGYLYVLDVGGFTGGYDDSTLLNLAKKARSHRVNQIVIEANYGDGMFTKLFQPVLARYWNCIIDEVKHYIQKEKRIIDTLEPVMMRHRLVVDLGTLKRDIQDTIDNDRIYYSLLYQMTRLTKDRGSLRHDDRLDVLAMAVRYWVDAMARDEEVAVRDYRESLLDEELRVFMDNVVGGGGYLRDSGDYRSTYLSL